MRAEDFVDEPFGIAEPETVLADALLRGNSVNFLRVRCGAVIGAVASFTSLAARSR